MSIAEPTQSALYIPGADDGSTQWLAQSMQLVNWGGFHGHHEIGFDDKSTLISGGSGTGKSTILDAYLALMMSSDVPFNGASNQARGRARSAERRNLLSYLRGQYGATADTEGRTKAQVLRGGDKATWGAIAVTFAAAEGARAFTVARIYYAAATAATAEAVTMRMVTTPGRMHLPDLEKLVASRFKPAEIRALFPQARTHETYQSFVNALESTLGIGTNGNGDSALRMLARVQSSAQLPDVDSLFKDTVLDLPRTFEQADNALRAFDVLDDSYGLMMREQERMELLGPIRGHRGVYDRARQAMTAHTQAKLEDPYGPAALWSEQLRYDVLEAALLENAAARTALSDALTAATATLATADAQRQGTSTAYNTAGGDKLAALTARVADLSGRLRERAARLERLTPTLAQVGVSVGDKDALGQLAGQAATGLGEALTSQRQLEDQQLELGQRLGQAARELEEARRDLDSFTGRPGRISRAEHERRCALAAAAGMDPADLPFIAELIDVADGQEGWRNAIETVLAAKARTVVVDVERREEFSARIDPKDIAGRIEFAFATANMDAPTPADQRSVAGKLIHQQGQWKGWVQSILGSHSVNSVCVDSTADLGRHSSAVTRAGQTRNGQRGAHGKSTRAHVIGFSNEKAIAAAQEQVASATGKREQVLLEVELLRAELGTVKRVVAAWQALGALDVDDYDIFTTADALQSSQEDLAALTHSDDRLVTLKDNLDRADAAFKAALTAQVLCDARLKELDGAHLELVESQDAASLRVEQVEQAGVVLSEELHARLEDALVKAAHPHDPRRADQLANLDPTLERMRRTLQEQVAGHEEAAARAAASIVTVFHHYQQRWPDPNLGEDLDGYDDYLAILDLIETSGLAEQRGRWRDEVLKWSGDALVPLNQTMEDAIADIQNRLDPVNDVLAGLPFGARGDRLRMDMRRITPAAVGVFRRELKEISSVATAGLSEPELVRRFAALRTFMAKLRTRDDPRAPRDGSDRDRLLDVRRQVEIKAEQVTLGGQHVAYHASLATYSGGETQEVGAFVAGAALRYRLGDDAQARPRFAPVLIDEAFIKADGEFTRRAVHAWQTLGFQLIIGAPEEKVQGVEKAMRRIVSVSKDLSTNLSYAHVLRSAPAAAR